MRTALLGVIVMAAAGVIAVGVWRIVSGPPIDTAISGGEAPEPPRGSPLPPSPADDGEEALVENPVYQHGTFKTAFLHPFRIRNRSAVPVKITGVRPSCTCAGHSLDRETIEPGGVARLTVEIQPRADRVGSWAYTLDVQYAAGAVTRSKRLTVVATYQPDTSIPEQVPLYCVSGQTATAKFSITDYRDEPMQIVAIKTSSPHLTARLAPTGPRTGPGHRIDVEVSHDGLSPVGETAEIVTLTTTDLARPTVVVRVEVNRVARLRVLPENLTLRRGEHGGHVGRVFVDDRLGRPLGAVKVVTSHPALGTTVNRLTEYKSAIDVRVEGNADAPLTLSIAAPECSTEEIQVKVFPCPEPPSPRP